MGGSRGEKGVKNTNIVLILTELVMVKTSFDKILDWLSSDDKYIEGITDDDLAEEDELFDDD